MSERLLSIVIVEYDTPEMLARCLDSIGRHLEGVPNEVVVVDNASPQDRVLALDRGRWPFARGIRLPANVGFGQGNNAGVVECRGDVLLLLNPDTELTDGSLVDAVCRFREAAGRELWGFRLHWPDGTFQNSFSAEIRCGDYLLSYSLLARLARFVPRIRSHKYDSAVPDVPTKVGVVYGTAMMMWTDDFRRLGGFDPAYHLYFEDIDLCDRFRSQLAGRIVYHPEVTIIHHVRSASGGAAAPPSREYLASKYRYGRRKCGRAAVAVMVVLDGLAGMARRIRTLSGGSRSA
jgi:N-acetylglucosaminyl-diphospho-decaprenol L-rhamnosyltransferase